MRKLALALVSTLAAVFVSSCGDFAFYSGNGTVTESSRDVSGFSSIVVGGEAVVRVHSSDTDYVVVSTDENLQDCFKSTVTDSTLSLEWGTGVVLVSCTELEIDVYTDELAGLDVSGSCAMFIVDAFEGTSLDVLLSGEGSMTAATIEYATIGIEVSGSFTIDVGGSADSMSLLTSGQCDFLGGDLVCADVDISISGDATVVTYATDYLDVDVSGSGYVRYYGAPKVNKSITGEGSVVHID